MTDATLPAGGVFISHCHEDNDLVRDLATYLARKGHVVYVDIESLRGGDTLGQAIARFINASSKVVVVLSKIAIGKRWVLTEIEWTLNREINEGLSLLVPYCLDREALDWFRKDTRLGCRLAVLGFGRPKEEALPELAKALPPPRSGRGARPVEARLSRDDEVALSIVDLVVESEMLKKDGKGEEALALASRAADEAREAGFDTEFSRAIEAQKSILVSQGRIEEAESLSGLAPPGPALVLEVLSGGTVGRLFPLEEGRAYVLARMLVSRGKLPLKESLRIGYYVAKALAHAAERGVVHRDVKPANVLVRYDGVVKLADFGLARQIEEAGLSRATRRDTDLGRVQYSPPESLGNAAPCDSRSDIYSLGATLYESLAGEKPFPVTTIDDAIREIRTRTPGPFTRSIQRSRRRSRRSSQERWRSAPRTGTPPPVP
ncbi:MAG: protein kinase [Planctomycetes bacterium]|nr:protein kinase [Planctomycetota bacterium]